MKKDITNISAIVPVEKTGSNFVEFFKRNRFFRNEDTEVILIVSSKKDLDFCRRFIYEDYAYQVKIKIVEIESDSECFVPRALNTGAMLARSDTLVFISQNTYIHTVKWEDLSKEVARARKLWGPKFTFKPEIIHTLSHKDIEFPMDQQYVFFSNFDEKKHQAESKYAFGERYWFDFFCMDKAQFLNLNGFKEAPEWFFGANNLEKRISTIRFRKLESPKVKGIHLGKPLSKSVLHKRKEGIPVLTEVAGEHPKSAEISALNLERAPEIHYSWDKDELPHPSSRYHHIDQHLHDLIMSGLYDNLDVLHLGFFFFERHSLFKIVQNVTHHARHTKQNWLSLQKHKIEHVFEFCNIVQPKIIHIHFAEIIDPSVFQFLKYKPKIIGTMHSEKPNPYYKDLDLLICISELSASYNKGSKKIIENTVWVDEHLVREEIDEHPDFCLTARFNPFVLSKETIEIYSNLKSDVWIYGYTQDEKARSLKNYALRFPNLNIIDWDNYVERMVAKHSIFSIIKPVVDSSYQYDMNVMEAVCLGMPCITTQKRQDYQTYVKDGYNGFVVSDSIEFIEKCNLLIEDRDLFVEMKKNALAHRKTIRNCMPEQYEEVYLSLL